MAKFLNTRRAVSEIEDIIKNAGERLVLISPFLKLSKDFRELLHYRNSKDRITTVVFGKQELNPDEMNFLQGLQFIKLKYNQDLHAKCYVNDERMIITSLNLYQYSMANNKEMGILIDKNDPCDTLVYEEAFKEVDYLIETSQSFDFGTTRVNNTVQTSAVSQFSSKKLEVPDGYCIRTGVKVPFNLEKPMSYEAYKAWNKNPDNPEKFCHFSGESSFGETNVNKPVLKRYWKKAQEIHHF